MIRLEKIERRYVTDDVQTTALTDVELKVEAGDFLAIMGPSGCGKSTLLNVLGTVDRPSGGRYYFAGRDLTEMNEVQLARFRAQTLGFVFQNFNLIDELTIEENIGLALAYRKDTSNRRGRVAAAMEQIGIAHRARHRPHQLSGGQQQRVAIARAIVGNPKLILADEPTGNLDSPNGQQVMDILADLNAEGATIVMVTHSASHASRARRRVDMLDGRIVASAASAI
jgi:putative ABC transport system ATP-binding protein